MENLNGKTAFITGGASGIGLAIAKACGKEGMNIIIADLRQNAIDEALPILKENGWPAVGIRLNVTDRAAYAKAVEDAVAAFGNIHLLVNNAGINAERGLLWEVSTSGTDLALSIIITAVLNGIRAVVPHMLEHGEVACVASTASKAGLLAAPQSGLYNLAKAAIISTMETLAEELEGTNVSASVFCPGLYKTNLRTSTNEVAAALLGDVEKVPSPPPQTGADRPLLPSQMVSVEDKDKIARHPDEAGERFIRGIKRGDLYILTHSEFKKGFKARADAILRAFPDEAPDELYVKSFEDLVYNPVFDKQTQVPAFKKG